ncbi:hypothetical protein D5086_005041, partial [Populus alba]
MKRQIRSKREWYMSGFYFHEAATVLTKTFKVRELHLCQQWSEPREREENRTRAVF